HGFWAVTADDPATFAPIAALDWSSFAAYEQPQIAGPKTLVPVRIWRYASGNPSAPSNQVGKVTLEATRAARGQPDSVLDAMLSVRPWRSSLAGVRPTDIGIDRGSALSLEDIKCLSGTKLRIGHLPEATTGGTHGPPLAPQLEAPPTFAARYYSA